MSYLIVNFVVVGFTVGIGVNDSGFGVCVGVGNDVSVGDACDEVCGTI